MKKVAKFLDAHTLTMSVSYKKSGYRVVLLRKNPPEMKGLDEEYIGEDPKLKVAWKKAVKAVREGAKTRGPFSSMRELLDDAFRNDGVLKETGRKELAKIVKEMIFDAEEDRIKDAVKNRPPRDMSELSKAIKKIFDAALHESGPKPFIVPIDDDAEEEK